MSTFFLSVIYSLIFLLVACEALSDRDCEMDQVSPRRTLTTTDAIR